MPAPRLSRLLVALNSTPEVDRATLARLGSCHRWLRALGRGSPTTERRIASSSLDGVRASLRHFEEVAERQARLAREAGAWIATRHDPIYPPALFDLPLPPPVLYVRGRLPETAVAVAIVGSRNARSYGLETARLFARYLAARGVVVVSGLALGIDSAAHRGALEAAGGRTIAVLGCGIDVEYPRGSRRLADRITGSGAVISELPIGARPFKHHFPMRNRIIAALGLGTLVVRAAARSGSLITARLALELGRDVYAPPGNIFDRRSIGPNSLIRDGALPVQHPREIVESLPLDARDRLEADESALDDAASGRGEIDESLAEHLKEVLRLLPPGEAASADSVAGRSGREVGWVLAALLELEVAGLVRRYPGPTFCRRG